jgi:hypothetical protein
MAKTYLPARSNDENKKSSILLSYSLLHHNSLSQCCRKGCRDEKKNCPFSLLPPGYPFRLNILCEKIALNLKRKMWV